MAAASPIASAIGGVPASKRFGISANSVFSKVDRPDHVAAALEGRHGPQQVGLAVEHADPARAVDLVAGEDEEIAIERLDVDLPVRRGLASRRSARGAPAACASADDVGDRRDRAERVGGMRDSHKLRARAQQPLVLLKNELAGIVDRHDLENDAEAVTQDLPGHDVRMVLQPGDHDLVAGLEVAGTQAVGHQIDGRGGIAREDDLGGIARR